MNMIVSMLVSNSNFIRICFRRPTWNLAMYNNARDRDSNSWCNYWGNFWKSRLITRYQFSSTNHCTRRAFGWRIAAIRSQRERNRSWIRYRLSTNWKNNSRGGKRVSCNFSTQSMYSYRKTPFRVRKSKSTALNLQNSEYTIFNLSLSRYDANLLRLVFRNLKESMNLNFTPFFFWKFFSFLSLVLSTCLVNEIYFSFVIDSTSTCSSYAVAISLIIKWAS